MQPRKKKISSFTVIVTFIALALAGVACAPLLSVRLSPSKALPGMSVSFSMPGNSSRVVEAEVTGKLEGLLTRVPGVKGISSSSYDGGGTITIDLDRHADVDMARFEVATVIRQAWSRLPAGVSYPSISLRRPDNNRSGGPFLTYTLTANSNPADLQRFCEEQLKPLIANVKGVSKIDIHGARPMKWELTFNTDETSRMGISADDIRSAISRNYGSEYLGMGTVDATSGGRQWIRVMLQSVHNSDSLDLDIPLKSVDGKAILLGEVVKVRHIEEEPGSYFRIDGKNSLYVSVTAEETANQLALANEINEIVDAFRRALPQGYGIELVYNEGDTIGSELDKIYFRTAVTLLILLLFVAAVTLSWRYVLLVTISLALTMGIACGLYYLFGIEIQLYSLAGITISLNLIIDNIIVMTDHISRRGNLRAFTAVLAASLTTVGALSVVWFLDEGTRLNLLDFVRVIIINLAVSLVTALFLVPALIDKIGMRQRRRRRGKFARRFSNGFTKVYSYVIRFVCRHRIVACVLLIFAFGFPVFLIPERLEGEGAFATKYNEITASAFYKEKFKPVFDKVFGGTLRLFAEKVPEGGYFSGHDEHETILYINATLPNGATLAQMNDLISRMESYLQKFDEIRQFRTDVYSARRASIAVRFRKDMENAGFPYQLKGDVIRKALTLGGGSWSVYGLMDMGFNNEYREHTGSSAIKMSGYNLDDLDRIAKAMRDTLLTYRRIKEVEIRSEVSYWKDDYTEYYLDIDRHRLAENGIDVHMLFGAVQPFFRGEMDCGSITIDRGQEHIRLRSLQSSEFDVWALMHRPFRIGDREFKLLDFATMNRRQAPQAVAKENQQYVLYAQYEYIGSYKQAGNVQQKIVDTFNDILPLGYKVEKYQIYGGWGRNDDGWNKYWLLALVGTIIFLMSSVLFNSLRQPLAIIAVIPPSFIGIFLAFYLFNFNFDQGGFASFILLSGITVNAAIYIINEYNFIRRRRPRLTPRQGYLKAYNAKIIPIFLTVFSTVLGFIPFVVGMGRESFWFPLAVGTMGGLVMSLVILIFYLPLFMLPKEKRKAKAASVKVEPVG